MDEPNAEERPSEEPGAEDPAREDAVREDAVQEEPGPAETDAVDPAAPRLGMRLLVPAIRLPRDYGRVDHFRQLARAGVAGFLVFGGDRELLPPLLASLRQAAGRPLLIMMDAERGMGQQVQGCLTLPPLLAVGATLSEDRAYEHGRVTALEAREIGINMLLAPVVDVLSLPTNPIVGNRALGSNPDLVAGLASAWIAGAQDQGVLACAKHFPGHGHTDADSHAELPIVTATAGEIRQRELVPFRAAIRAGVGAVMTAHVAYPALDPTPRQPASLSSPILRIILRDTFGFGGLVLSDALVMSGLLTAGDAAEPLEEPEAAVRCVEAGCDLLLHPSDSYAVADALEAAAEASRIDVAAIKSRLDLTLADLLVHSAEPQSIAAEHLYDAYGLARDSLTALRNDARLLPLTGRRGPVLALLIDDDDEPDRERRFRERSHEFAGGFARLTDWSGDAAADPLLAMVDDAAVVVLAIACDQRAWKGRMGLKPSLAGFVDHVLERAPQRTLTLLLSAPGVLHGLSREPRTVVAAWGDAPVSIQAALDVVLSGGPMRGLDPAPPDAA